MSAQASTVTPLKPDCTAEEWEARVNLAACYRLVAHYGWDDMIFTHISAKLPDGNFLINPYGMFFDEITASSLVKIDLQGNILQDTPYAVNPAGFTIHSAVHEVREDASCVIHLHTVPGTAVATSNEGLLPLNQTAMLVRENIAYHEYEGVALDHDERPRLQADLGTKKLMLLWNHGTLAIGESIPEAFMNIYFLERACEMQVATLSCTKDVHIAPEGIPEKTGQTFAMPGAGQYVADELAWPALLRKLDRIDPSFRD